jgi:sec-independent protein translocase protein TatA
MLGGISSTELIIIFLIVFFLFGGKKIPEIARGIGEALKEFKKSSKVEKDDEDNSSDSDE